MRTYTNYTNISYQFSYQFGLLFIKTYNNTYIAFAIVLN